MNHFRQFDISPIKRLQNFACLFGCLFSDMDKVCTTRIDSLSVCDTGWFIILLYCALSTVRSSDSHLLVSCFASAILSKKSSVVKKSLFFSINVFLQLGIFFLSY